VTVKSKLITMLCIAVLLFVGVSAAQSSNPVQYFYDDLGRLTKAVDPSGNVATYRYDAVGNLLSITRSTVPANNGLAVLSFTPQQGTVGQTVTIQGQGFSTTLSSDAVQFNGVSATITAATATTLTAVIPPGATTGPISATVSGNSATSDSDFTVLTLASIFVTPSTATVATNGGVQQYHATGTLSNSTTRDVTASVVWSSSNPSLAAISPTQGLATGMAAGTVTITATSGTVSGSATLVVSQFSSLNVTPISPAISQGGTVQFTATASTGGPSTFDQTANATWTSSNPSVATISNAPGSRGLATGVVPGNLNVCASIPGFTQCTTATVVPVLVSLALTPANSSLPKGEKQQFSATGTYSDGSIQDVTSTMAWSSSNPLLAIVSNASFQEGAVTALDLGTATITATSGSVTGSTSLTVTAPVPTAINVVPVSATLAQGGTVQFSSQTTLSDGTKGPDSTTTATWSSSDPTVATVSNTTGSQGLAMSVGPGAVTVTATLGSLSGSASIVVANTTGSVFPRFAYVANAADNTISLYTVSPANGQFRSTGYVVEPQVTNPFAVALDPSDKFLFVANSENATVSVYAVSQSNGALAQVAGSPFATGLAPSSVFVDPAANFVYVVNSGDVPGDVSAFAFDPTSGALTPVAGSPFLAGNGAKSAAGDAAGQFLYVTNTKDGTISAFTIGATTGVLTPVTGQPFPAGTQPTGVTVDPSGKFVVVANGRAGGGGGTSQLLTPGVRETNTAFASTVSLPEGSAAELGDAGYGSKVVLAAYQPARENSFGTTRDSLGFMSLRRVARAMPQAGGGSPQVGPGPGVSVFTIDPTSGALTPVSGSPFASGGSQPVVAVAIDPTGKFVYAANIAGGLSAFTLDPSSGMLNLLGGSPYATNFSPSAVAVDPSGLFVYVTDSRANDITTFGISPGTGALVSLGSLPARRGAAALAISSGAAALKYVPEFAYVADSGGTALSGATTGSNNVLGFAVDPVAGGLTSVTGPPFAEGLFPTFATTDLLGQFLYVANTCSDPGCAATTGSLSVFGIDATAGALTAAPSSPFVAGSAPLGAVVDPSGRFAYVVNSNDETISGYAIDPTSGASTLIPGSPFALGVTGTGPASALTIDPTGQFLYAATSCSNNTCSGGTISVYQISPSTGALTLAFSPQSFGASPSSLVVEPRGEFLYATDSASNNVIAISVVDAVFGLGEINGSPFAAGSTPSSLAVDPSGQFLYVANTASNNISAYTIDPGGSGSLTQIAGSPFQAGANPVSVTVDVSGKFAYVVNKGDNTVSAFSIDPVLGTLTPVSGSPFAAGTVPISITTTGKTQ
jgi:YD repeat-containing protein